MKTRLFSALGLALLAASLTFTSSFACSNSSDEQTSVVNAPAAEVAQPSAAEFAQPTVAEVAKPPVAEVALPSVALLNEPSSIVSESEPSATEESAPPAIYAVDAIRVEVIQSITIAAPGEDVKDEQPTRTGSIAEEIAPLPTAQSDEAIVVEATQTVTVVESAEDEQPAYTGSPATEVARSTAGETTATKSGLLPDEDKTALDSNDP
jgi:hypothetical protein